MVRALAIIVVLVACEPSSTQPDAPASPWRAGPTLPGRRVETSAVALGTRLVIAGGFSTTLPEGLAISDEIFVLDTLARDPAWVVEPRLAPAKWTHVNLAASAGVLYVLGGLEGQQQVARGDSWRLTLDDPDWLPLPAPPAGQERGAAAIVVSPPHLYVLGGSSGMTTHASCLEYNLLENRWFRLPDLPIPISHAAAMRTLEGTLIVAGGTGAQGEALGTVWALPLGAMGWEPRTSLDTGRERGDCAYGEVYGRLICAGGRRGAAAVAFVDLYDPDGDAWLTVPDMPVERAGAAGAVIGQQLYVAGGAPVIAFEPTDTLWIFSLHDVRSAL